jgi:hypothetical protein
LGVTSTSLNRKPAEEFALDDQRTKKEAALFKIMWKASSGYFYMNTGAFPQENEVIIADGTEFEVVNVEKENS